MAANAACLGHNTKPCSTEDSAAINSMVRKAKSHRNTRVGLIETHQRHGYHTALSTIGVSTISHMPLAYKEEEPDAFLAQLAEVAFISSFIRVVRN
jgi:hypothetical protein